MKRIPLLMLALGAGVASAQNDRMEHVLVSVPIHKKSAETALPVTVLTGEELRRRAATTIGETLANKPGLASASFGPGVGRPVIRGQEGPRSLTLENGISSADVSSLSPDHAVSVEPMLANSIEVLRGPATLLYGGGAIGGVVNVMDNRIPRAPIEGSTGGIEYRHDTAAEMNSVVYRLEGGNGKAAYHLSGSNRDWNDVDIPGDAIDESALPEADHPEDEAENSRGNIDNSDGNTDVLTAGTSYHFGDRGFFGLALSQLENNYGIPPGAHGHSEHEDHEEEGDHDHDDDGHDEEHGDEEHSEEEAVSIELKQTRYDALLHWHQPLAGIEVLRGFLTYTDYEHKEIEGSAVGTRFERDTWEARLEIGHVEIADFHGVVGLQWRSDEFSALGDEAYVPKTDSEELGVFIIEDYHVDALTLEFGARADWVERDPDTTIVGSRDFSNLSFSASALWDIDSQWSVGLALSHSERAPATQELYSNIEAQNPSELVIHAATGAIEIGDASLDQEASQNIDLSLNWNREGVWAEATLFYNHFDDYIGLFNTGAEFEGSEIYAYEQDDAVFYGVELQATIALAQMASGELLLEVFGDSISASFDNNGKVPRLPPSRVGAELSWSGDFAGAWLRVLVAADQDATGRFESATEGYTRWDAGYDYLWELSGEQELTLFLKLMNIGDEEIRESTSFLRNFSPQPGRSLQAGLRYSF
jgi:iron complex outermembrane receptor protein